MADLNTLRVPELKALAKASNIPQYYLLRKQELIDALTAVLGPKTARKSSPAKKSPPKKHRLKKTPAKKTPAKKTPAKKTPAKKPPPSPARRPVRGQIELFSEAKFDSNTNPKTLLNPSDVFEDLEILGHGNYGEVHKIRDKGNNKLYALKHIYKLDPIVLKEEIQALKYISAFPNCEKDFVCYYDAFQFKNKYGRMQYGVLMEYVPGVTLDKYIRTITLTQKEAIEIAIWLTDVLAFLHEHNYIHRDIKIDNIIVTDNGNLKLIDFGFTCASKPNLQVPECDYIITGTPGFVPPELTKENRSPGREERLKKGDVFAAGVTLYYIVENALPYRVNNMSWEPIGPMRPMTFPNKCYDDIVERMISLRPEPRPTAAQARDEFTRCKDQL